MQPHLERHYKPEAEVDELEISLFCVFNHLATYIVRSPAYD